MSNPTMPAISDAQANSYGSGAPHDETGIAYIPFDADEGDSPPVYTRLIQLFHHLMELMGGVNQGRVYPQSGLDVGAFALKYAIGATEYGYAGDASFALTADATNCIYLDTDATLKKSTSGWPGGDHIKLAKAVCDATSITSIEDSRLKNYRVGSLTNWWAFAPTAAVDLNGQQLNSIGRLQLAGPTDKTIDASGDVTIGSTDSGWLRLDTYGAAGTDDLTGILPAIASGNYGRILILSCADGARVVTVKDSATIQLRNGDCVLDDPEKFLALLLLDGKYTELFRSEISPALLSADLDANSKDISNIGTLNLAGFESLTIATGVVTKTRSWAKLFNQNNDPTDELDTISGGTTGDHLILQARSAGQVPTIKHGTGNIELMNDRDCELSDLARVLELHYDGSTWREVSRSHAKIFDLTATDEGKGLRWEPTHYISEAVAINTTYSLRIYVNVTTWVDKFVANVVTAPSGGPCVVQLLDDGTPIATATIADGTTEAIASGVDATVAAGSILEIRTTTINGAAKLSATIIARRGVPAS